ncbi:MAG: threonine--tRNA ligase, partial [Oscillospiraceae bacterium]|nr:threonine--tRNA ligase [Oscillospiraceae bacterium]
VGAEYTLSTCQLDFCLPAKFDLKYIDRDGSEKTPVVLHRAILGSLDRFMAYLLEETMGNLPTWIAPEQVRILTVTDRVNAYADSVCAALADRGVRAELDERNEKIGKKIREAQTMKIPYMLVIGDKEVENGQVSVRTRAGGDQGAMGLDAFIAQITEEIDSKAR